jgi:hypothetical protein
MIWLPLIFEQLPAVRDKVQKKLYQRGYCRRVAERPPQFAVLSVFEGTHPNLICRCPNSPILCDEQNGTALGWRIVP